uniref:NADH-ubiquinone oxidoreductase chain 6 n=1 Tax=Allotermes sp. TaxID=2942750 RepID=A0A8X8M2X3_9NEOP|nr:NADH dehydrogenase subunit 6 [Allotermes cf. paradoxus]URX53925.1 NADH dehydrogenase subunit 6 [Allotermes sp.]
MKALVVMSTLMSTVFTQTIHPLAMGMILLTQTMLTCLISGIMHQSFWFQYILFMVFVGGMLVLFIYVASLASNEMFSLSTKLVMMMAVMMPMMLAVKSPTMMNSKETLMHKMTVQNEILTMTTKMYNYPQGWLTVLMAMYLLMTLIVVVKITNVSKGPLRQTS